MEGDEGIKLMDLVHVADLPLCVNDSANDSIDALSLLPPSFKLASSLCSPASKHIVRHTF
jgi:hypothetical protein